MPMVGRGFSKKRQTQCLAKGLVSGRYLINVSDTHPWKENQVSCKTEVGWDIQFLLLKPKVVFLVGIPRKKLKEEQVGFDTTLEFSPVPFWRRADCHSLPKHDPALYKYAA